MISTSISQPLFKGKQYDIVILDVNSLFLFSKDPTKKLYEFINAIKLIFKNNDIMFINVIDNGLNRRMRRKFPQYKANRITSKESSRLGGFGYLNKKNKFKGYIDKIHRCDRQFKNHLTFFATGEADFKIGYILNLISSHTHIDKANVLTVANDKDMILTSIMGDVLLKRQKGGKYYLVLFRDGKDDLPEFKTVMSLDDLSMKTISDYYYFLLLNGDAIDNIKKIFTLGKTKKFLNYIYEKEGEYNIDLICKYIGEFKDDVVEARKDVIENTYLVDMFNNNTFTGQQQTNMTLELGTFFKDNDVEIFR